MLQHDRYISPRFRKTPLVATAACLLWLCIQQAGADFVVFDSTNSPLGAARIASMAAVSAGNVVVETEDRWLLRTDGSDWAVLAEMNSGALVTIAPIVADNDGVIWYGTYNDGIAKATEQGQSYLDSSNSCIKGFWGIPLGIGADGTMICSYGGYSPGTALLSVRNVVRYSGLECVPVCDRLPSGGEWLVARYSRDSTGAEWFAYRQSYISNSPDSVYKVVDGAVSRVPFAPSGWVWRMYSGPENTWISWGSRLHVFPYQGERWHLDSIAGNRLGSVGGVLVDRRGTLWIGASSGVYRILGSDTTHYDTSNSSLPGNGISSIVEDDMGRLWFGAGKGLALFSYPQAELGRGGGRIGGVQEHKNDAYRVDVLGRAVPRMPRRFGVIVVVNADGFAELRVTPPPGTRGGTYESRAK